MDEKSENTLPRQQLAAYLERLAAQLRAGTLRADQQTRQVPEAVEIRTHIRDKKGRFRFQLEFRWSSLADYDDAGREATAVWERSLKQVKRDLARSFKELKAVAVEKLAPEDPVLQEFAAHSRAFVELAEADWLPAAQEYLGHLENLLHAVREGQSVVVRHEILDLQQRMIACHKDFR
jgi:XXXCH domain-containing protein